MNKLQQLIQELCPDGVEWKTLGDVCEQIKGVGLSKADKGLGTVPIILYGELYTTYGNYIQNVVSSTSEDCARCATLILKHDLLLPLSSTTKEAQIGKVSSFELDSPCFLGGDALILRHKQNAGFLMYLINSSWFEAEKMKCVKGTTINHLDYKKMTKISIPIPPLPVQTEIVRILDKFSTLTAELQAELQARKSQYEYYEDNLLDFHDAPYYSLKDLCDIVDYRGKTPKKVTEGIFLVTAKNIRNGYIDYEKSKEYISNDDFDVVMHRGKVRKGDVLITTEAPCGNVALVDREDIALAQRVIKYRPKNMNLNSSFLKYILMGKEFQSELQATATGGTVKGIKGSKLHKLTIPLPPLAEQARIVAILDKFDTLTNSISEGLPKEIELRQKQYEYYRDMLLTFPQKTA